MEQAIQEKTQEILKMQIGDLVLTCARLRAERDVLLAELAKLTAPPPVPPT